MFVSASRVYGGTLRNSNPEEGHEQVKKNRKFRAPGEGGPIATLLLEGV